MIEKLWLYLCSTQRPKLYCFFFIIRDCKTGQIIKTKYKNQINIFLSCTSEISTHNHTSAFKGLVLLPDSWHDCKKKGMCQVELPMLSMAGFNILMCFITTVWAR